MTAAIECDSKQRRYTLRVAQVHLQIHVLPESHWQQHGDEGDKGGSPANEIDAVMYVREAVSMLECALADLDG